MANVNVELILPFVKATHTVFESMMAMKVARKKVYLKQGHEMTGDISGIIGLSGTAAGTCAISLPGSFAVKCVEAMICEPLADGLNDAAAHDGVGEMINMIAGHAKATLSTTKYRFDITLPTIISGKTHEVFNRKGTDCVVILFEAEDHTTFTLDVCIAEVH